MKIDCICPPKGGAPRHPDGDTVELRPRLDFRSANTILKAVQLMQTGDEDVETAEVLALLTEHYLIYGIESWSLEDDKDKPVPVSKTTIRDLLLPSQAAMVVGDAADDLYSEQVMLPLVARAARLLQPSPTDDSTSAPTDSAPPRPKPSKPSSISTIPTAATATTTSSLDGDSSSSQSSTSAA